MLCCTGFVSVAIEVRPPREPADVHWHGCHVHQNVPVEQNQREGESKNRLYRKKKL